MISYPKLTVRQALPLFFGDEGFECGFHGDSRRSRIRSGGVHESGFFLRTLPGSRPSADKREGASAFASTP
jgi:hypothetical protein